jgi:hypothetical protein
VYRKHYADPADTDFVWLSVDELQPVRAFAQFFGELSSLFPKRVASGEAFGQRL